MTESVLITGGMGYLGGRIILKLLEQNKFELRVAVHKVPTPLPKWLERGHVIPIDILSEADLAVVCRGVQSIIHLAALNEIESESNPEQALLVNGLGTLKLLRAAEDAGVKRFIYFSTAHVYGSPLVGKITETTLPRPVHPYAITHRIAEDFVLAAHDRKVICAVVLRLSNGFGAPVHSEINRWTLVVNDLCRQAATDRKIVLRSSGLQVRDFVTIEDITRAVVHFLHLPASEYRDGLFNLGGENPMRIIDVAEFISFRCSKVLGFVPEITHPSPRPNETSEKLNYCTDKLKSTGFRLQGNVNEEIDNTLKLCLDTFGNRP